MDRVVVTGLGAVSCIGNDAAAFWQSLKAGRSGIAPIAAFDASALTVQIAGEVKDFQFDAKLAKRMERFAQFAMVAAHEALAQAGLEPGEGGVAHVDPDRIGVCVGTGIGGEPFLEREHEKFLKSGRFHKLTVPIVIANMAAANIAIHYHLGGPNQCITTACATGNHNIAAAMDMIRLGRADVIVAGGTESTIAPFAVDGYHQLRALSTRNDDPQTASRPFSRERDGFVIAEGAGVLVLESLSHARARGAAILAEAAGYGSNADAYHLTAPSPDGMGAVKAMRLALADAQLNPQDVGYINAHGTSTPHNDATETLAIKLLWGEHARTVPVSSIKSMIGHSLGGAAGLEAVASVLAIREGVIPPTINLDDPDPELDLDYVPHTAREATIGAALSNSFGFGGHNCVLAFRRFS